MTFVSLKLVHFRGDFGITFFSAFWSFPGTLRRCGCPTEASIFRKSFRNHFLKNLYFDHTDNKPTFQATNPKQNKAPHSPVFQTNSITVSVHSFNVKPIKMLSDPVAEAFGLIHRHPSGENLWYGMACLTGTNLSE